MKTTDNLNTTHIDKSIVLFFVFAILITASVFSYRYINHTPCDISGFDAEAKIFRAGEIVSFKDHTTGNVN